MIVGKITKLIDKQAYGKLISNFSKKKNNKTHEIEKR